MCLLLKDKLALVTGGGSGIGRATCLVLAREGAIVVVTDVNLESAQETLEALPGAGHIHLHLDVTNTANITSVFNKITDTFKHPPSVIVNCAGILYSSYIQESTTNVDSFQRLLNTNLMGMFAVVQAGADALIKEGLPGSFINISSVASTRCVSGQSFYAASKAGVDALTKSIAKEIAKNDIRCNTINPGFIETPMASKLMEARNVLLDKVLNECAMKRIGKPEEVAEVVAFLASDKSSYITGACIPVNGGMIA